MEDKIKVNLSYRDYYSLMNDMSSFGYIKENGDPKRNQFINQLVCNYYKDDENRNELISSLLDQQLKNNIKGDVNDLKDSILSIALNPPRDSIISMNRDCSISFRPNKENVDIFNYIEVNLLQNQSISNYFRTLFHNYLRLNQSEREAVIFTREVNFINEAIQKKKVLKIRFNKENVDFYPYEMKTTKEENFIYVIGLLGGKSILSIHLYKVVGLTLTNHSFEFTPTQKKELQKVSSSAIEYGKGEIVNAEIVLNKAGEKSFRNIWHNRPEPYKVEGNRYFFIAPFYQLIHYFTRFGSEAEVIKPEKLRSTFKLFYSQGLNNYQ